MAHIGKFCQLPPERSGIIAPFFEHRVYKKKASLLDEGQRCYEKFFILKGCVHICYLKQNGVEQTIDFALENWWISDFMAFPNGAPAQFSIRAVENTEVLCISADSQRALLNEVPEMHAYFHLVFQKAYAASQVRMKLLYELPKEELYRHFHQHFPGFIQRVPQYLLASFLGFTPEYLSEIRRKYLS
jgi:cAMP-binding proteins - catabolite gene activator and regulatory subunit of cAMP-dependent protein kinases